MSKHLTAIAFFGAMTISGAAFAQGVSFGVVDSDQNGLVSFEELAAAVPSVTADMFKAADVDQNSSLDQDEFEALGL